MWDALFEMLTGKPPWSECGNAISTMFKIANGNEPPTLPEEISSEFKKISIKEIGLIRCIYFEIKNQRML